MFLLHILDKTRVLFITEICFRHTPIGHFGKYHNILCLSPQILHKHCFQFLLGLTIVPREYKNNAYAKFGGTNKEYYGTFRSGLLDVKHFFVRWVFVKVVKIVCGNY